MTWNPGPVTRQQMADLKSLMADRDALIAALSDALDTMRAVIDQKAIRNVPHLPDGGAALVADLHERIVQARTALGEDAAMKDYPPMSDEQATREATDMTARLNHAAWGAEP